MIKTAFYTKSFHANTIIETRTELSISTLFIFQRHFQICAFYLEHAINQQILHNRQIRFGYQYTMWYQRQYIFNNYPTSLTV